MDTEKGSASIQSIPGRCVLGAGNGGLAKWTLNSPFSEAEVFANGAHVTRFQKTGEPPALFMSAASEFSADRPIRGGIPVIFPWFGPREGLPAHGYARVTAWEAVDVSIEEDGSTRLRLRLPRVSGAASVPDAQVELSVAAGETLAVECDIENRSDASVLDFEFCLHTYLQIGRIDAITVHGLHGARFQDTMDRGQEKTESRETIRIGEEVDRIYFDTERAVEIVDPVLQRVIRVDKWGARSTVLWNPWVAKARRMPDFGDEEYRQMVCVESGNVGPNRLSLPPKTRTRMGIRLSTRPL